MNIKYLKKCDVAKISVNTNKMENGKYTEEDALLKLEKVFNNNGYKTFCCANKSFYTFYIDINRYNEYVNIIKPIYKNFKKENHIR